MTNCPLCLNTANIESIKGVDRKSYSFCPSCKLIFSLPESFLTAEEEKERYLHHNNGIQYPGYVKFLNQALEPAMDYLKTGMECLDYGCGPVPTLSIMAKRNGLLCDDYDPLFFPGLPDKEYDAIFATECFEHFYNPEKEIKTITSHLKENGYLFLMTNLWEDMENFHSWHYTNDETHVAFYHKDTFSYIAKHFGYILKQIINNRVVILQKRD